VSTSMCQASAIARCALPPSAHIYRMLFVKEPRLAPGVATLLAHHGRLSPAVSASLTQRCVRQRGEIIGKDFVKFKQKFADIFCC
jgi:hypothetical protein